MRPEVPDTKPRQIKIKLQTDIPYEYWCKDPQQNTTNLN